MNSRRVAGLWVHLVCSCGEYYLPQHTALRTINADHLAAGHRLRQVVTVDDTDVARAVTGRLPTSFQPDPTRTSQAR